MSKNVLIRKLHEGRVLLGLGQMYPASGIIEGMCKGWDFVWIDGQHGEMSYDSILHAVQAAMAAGVEGLVRVPGHEHSVLGQYADLAPAAIMVPMVETRDQARYVARGLCFPPLGNRSYGGRRLVDIHGRDAYREYELLVVAQIETVQSVENASDIISTEGVGCLFFGPDDMKVQMGIPVNTPVLENKRLLDAMARTAQAAREAGKFAGTVASDKDTLRVALEMGYRMIVGGSDIVFLRTLAAQRLKELRGVCEEPRPSGPAGTGAQG